MPEENAGAPESQICGNLRGVVGQLVGVRGVRVATAVRCPVDRTVRPEAVNDGRRDAGEVCRWIGGKSRGEVLPDRDGASIGGFGLVCCKDDVAVADGRNPANSALAPLRWLRCAGSAALAPLRWLRPGGHAASRVRRVRPVRPVRRVRPVYAGFALLILRTFVRPPRGRNMRYLLPRDSLRSSRGARVCHLKHPSTPPES